MPKQMRVGVKSAWITLFGAVLVAVITGVFMYSSSNKTDYEEKVQTVNDQKANNGVINNNNAGRDFHIENKYYADTSKTENERPNNSSLKKKKAITSQSRNNFQTNANDQTNVTSINQSGGQTAKEITNNY